MWWGAFLPSNGRESLALAGRAFEFGLRRTLHRNVESLTMYHLLSLSMLFGSLERRSDRRQTLSTKSDQNAGHSSWKSHSEWDCT
jgi:hypothetical protein